MNIHAWTAVGHFYPQYISVNEDDTRAANGERVSTDIVFTVRSAPKGDVEGPTAEIKLTRRQVKVLVLDLLKELFKG